MSKGLGETEKSILDALKSKESRSFTGLCVNGSLSDYQSGCRAIRRLERKGFLTIQIKRTFSMGKEHFPCFPCPGTFVETFAGCPDGKQDCPYKFRRGGTMYYKTAKITELGLNTYAKRESLASLVPGNSN